MFGMTPRFGAVLCVPLIFASGAAAQYAPQGPQYGVYEETYHLLLYSGRNFTGEVREVFEPAPALGDYYFNDRVRSIRVMSGAWEVCEDSGFTGRCVFIRQDIADLDWFGLSGELSSVRPEYEYTEAAHGLMFYRDRGGNIQYANSRYGYQDYAYGMSTSYTTEYYHYGYSPSYHSYGYYNPSFGYGPYGFAYTRYGVKPAYHKHYSHSPPPLRGHYGAKKGAVTLYVDSNKRGASLGLNGAIPNLGDYRFNDKVSSLTIRSGTWQVCEHANYRGRCQIVDASVYGLTGLRLNDKISSIRPVGDVPHSDRSKGGGHPEDRYESPPPGKYKPGAGGQKYPHQQVEKARAVPVAAQPPRIKHQDTPGRQKTGSVPPANGKALRGGARPPETLKRSQPGDVRRANIAPPPVQSVRPSTKQTTRSVQKQEEARSSGRQINTPAMKNRQPQPSAQPSRTTRPQPAQPVKTQNVQRKSSSAQKPSSSASNSRKSQPARTTPPSRSSQGKRHQN